MSDLPSWLSDRCAGVLLHITSLPSSFGVGALGNGAKRWIDFLADAGFRFWQTCPVGPTGFGDSPYQVFSSSAGNPYFIDWDEIVDLGYIQKSELSVLEQLPCEQVDYAKLYELFDPLLRTAFVGFQENPHLLESKYGSLDSFINIHADWLYPYTAYQLLKYKNELNPWWKWPEQDRASSPELIKALNQPTDPDCLYIYFQQFLFRAQWKNIRSYAQKKGISIIGDLPIYVAPDSADAWAEPSLFQIDPNLHFQAVAGVPPDYFNEDGQYWGNPLYDWPIHEREDYRWWTARISDQLDLFDILRIDHFRAFHDYWSIPATAKHGKEGMWMDGPDEKFWQHIGAAFPHLPFLAEDLGEIHEGVRTLRTKFGLPGMAVLQFAFSGEAENLYLPHNLTEDLVLYTGTHDNDTAVGWYNASSEQTRSNFRRYFNVSGDAPGWEMLRQAYRSVSTLVIVQTQDLLSLGTEARFNKPGHEQGNWKWRMTSEQLNRLWQDSSSYLREQALLTGRLCPNLDDQSL